MEAEVSDSGVQNTTVLREPIHADNRKMKVNIFFRALRRETVAMSLYTLPSAVTVPLQNISRWHWGYQLCLKKQDTHQEFYQQLGRLCHPHHTYGKQEELVLYSVLFRLSTPSEQLPSNSHHKQL